MLRIAGQRTRRSARCISEKDTKGRRQEGDSQEARRKDPPVPDRLCLGTLATDGPSSAKSRTLAGSRRKVFPAWTGFPTVSRRTRDSSHRGLLARVTVEDCIEKVPNRFHLVQMVTIRTKQLKKGAKPLVDSQENKAVVMAPREIAAGYVKPDYPAAASETRSHGEFDTGVSRSMVCPPLDRISTEEIDAASAGSLSSMYQTT